MANITYRVSIQVDGGPHLVETTQRAVQACEKIDIAIDAGGAGAAEVKIDLQPGAANKVMLLCVRSGLYAPELSVIASDGVTDSAKVALTGPLLLNDGAVGLLGIAPKQLKFKNELAAGDPTKRAVIEIFVGRDAVV